MNSARLAVQRTAPVGIPTTPAGRNLNAFRVRQHQALTAAAGLGNAAEALGLTATARSNPDALDPTGRLAEFQAALAADNVGQAAQLLDAMLTAGLDAARAADEAAPDDEPPVGGQQRPKHKRYRKQLSQTCWLMIAIRIY